MQKLRRTKSNQIAIGEHNIHTERHQKHAIIAVNFQPHQCLPSKSASEPLRKQGDAVPPIN